MRRHTPRADPDRGLSNVFPRLFCPVSCRNTPAPPRFPSNPHRIPPLNHANAAEKRWICARVPTLRAHLPCGRFWRHYRGWVKRRVLPLAGRVSGGYAGCEPDRWGKPAGTRAPRPYRGLPYASGRRRSRFPPQPSLRRLPSPRRTGRSISINTYTSQVAQSARHLRPIPVGPIGRVVCEAGIRGPPCCRQHTQRATLGAPYMPRPPIIQI
jgi:hypothetical protein